MSSKSLVPLDDLLHCSTTAKDWASKLWTQYGITPQKNKMDQESFRKLLIGELATSGRLITCKATEHQQVYADQLQAISAQVTEVTELAENFQTCLEMSNCELEAQSVKSRAAVATLEQQARVPKTLPAAPAATETAILVTGLKSL